MERIEAGALFSLSGWSSSKMLDSEGAGEAATRSLSKREEEELEAPLMGEAPSW